MDCLSQVSPGWKPRPSLSADLEDFIELTICAGVAGVEAPAFVERRSMRFTLRVKFHVSPGWKPRPSLSGIQPSVLDG